MKKALFTLLLLVAVSTNLHADLISEKVYKEDTSIDSARYNQLHFVLPTLSFFKNNEFDRNYIKGYTLPGFWLAPRLSYYAAKNVKLELGAHLLAYWGANRYPVAVYQDIPEWNTAEHSSGFFALPFFRAHWAPFSNFDVVVGNLYGRANHNLSEPLYFPELNLTADPEAGVQMLYRSHVFEGDMWINWESFIFKGSPHQEAFTFGISSKFNTLEEGSRFELSIPLQALANHRGGEINDKTVVVDGSVKTLINAGSGLRFAYSPEGSLLKRVQFETLGFLFYQQAGKVYPFTTGWGVYPSLSVDFWDVQARVSYWRGKDFVSITGIPFYNSVGYEGEVLDAVQNVSASLQYCKEITKTIAIGADVSLYYMPSASGVGVNNAPVTFGSSMSYSYGVSLRINPDFRLWSFSKKN